MKKLTHFYSEERYIWKDHRRTLYSDPDGYLFSGGRYKTKVRAADLPEWYVYGSFYKRRGYMAAKGVKHLVYRPNKFTNHMFKDDFLFISYDRPIVADEEAWKSLSGYDEYIFGGIILAFLLAAEKYSGYDISEIKTQIEDKRLWFKETFPEFYRWEVPEDRPLFGGKSTGTAE